MVESDISSLPAWASLKYHSERMNLPENHLKHLVRQPDRFERYSLKGAGMFYDFSCQRVDDEVIKALIALAGEKKVIQSFKQMMAGVHVNTTEDRAALHTAARNFTDPAVYDSGRDVMPEIRRVREEIRQFSHQVHTGEIRGSKGLPFKDVVVIGIGGSCLGPESVAIALEEFADKGISLHFLSNVDIYSFGRIAARIMPETTLWVIVSKSYTTVETMANAHMAAVFMKEKGLDPRKHLVTVTSKGSPGDDPANPVLRTFHMFDYIGGRFSITSAVGGVPLSLFAGYDIFERLLKGAEEVDRHAASARPEENIPLTAALIGIWNNNFLGYPAWGVIPYAAALARLPAHIQQLYMESNGKRVTREGKPVNIPTGMIVFGEPGTSAQHSFFQLAHQGRPFPIDFIGVVNPCLDRYTTTFKGVTHHQELWANLMAQPRALAEGMDDPDPARSFPGNRPSSTLLINDLSPENIGRLLAFYEAKTVLEAFVWGVNPFDQFGVELGKTMASAIRREMSAKNEHPDHTFDHLDPINRFYLNTLFNRAISS